MRLPAPHRSWRVATLTAVAVALIATDGPAIEMFTFFGDGSRIGLPSLEVPVEAYPGIPLRSDRLRARRRAMRMGPGSAVQIGPPGYARGVTIRAMPDPNGASPTTTVPQPRGLEVAPPLAETPGFDDGPPLAPEPEDLTPPASL
jgi:hypothetical protein